MKKIYKKIKMNGGMTIMELVVVLAIYAVLSLVVMFNYGKFQSSVDIENLANDIAEQVVQAQSSALAGLLPPTGHSAIVGWKPSYGVYFSSTSAADAKGADTKDFIYFVDLNNDNLFDGSSCPSGTLECLSKYTITKNNYIIPITGISVVCTSPAGACVAGSIPNLTVAFDRPNSGATLYSGVTALPDVPHINYVEIKISDPNKDVTAKIDLYPSGRVQIS